MRAGAYSLRRYECARAGASALPPAIVRIVTRRGYMPLARPAGQFGEIRPQCAGKKSDGSRWDTGLAAPWHEPPVSELARRVQNVLFRIAGRHPRTFLEGVELDELLARQIVTESLDPVAVATKPAVQHHDLAAVVDQHEPMLALVCAESLHEHVVTRLGDTAWEGGNGHRRGSIAQVVGELRRERGRDMVLLTGIDELVHRARDRGTVGFGRGALVDVVEVLLALGGPEPLDPLDFLCAGRGSRRWGRRLDWRFCGRFPEVWGAR